MFDIAIIGAGPAGSSAALMAAKAGKKVLVIDSDQSVTRRAWVENHYGVMEITGPELFDTGKKQAEKFGAEIQIDKVTGVSGSKGAFQIQAENNSYEAAYLVLATGLMTDLAERIGVNTKPGTEPRIKTVVDCDAAGRTNVEGIWAAGTCAGVSMHTIITAGDGAKAAVNIVSEMNGERYVDHDVMK